MFGIGHWEILMLFVIIVFGSLFWLWMLVECALREPNTRGKAAWVILIAVTHSFGALIYFLARRLRRVSGH